MLCAGAGMPEAPGILSRQDGTSRGLVQRCRRWTAAQAFALDRDRDGNIDVLIGNMFGEVWYFEWQVNQSLLRGVGPSNHTSIAVPLPWFCLVLPCRCRVVAAPFSRFCRVFAVSLLLPCLCRGFAVFCSVLPLPWFCRAFCSVLAVLLPCLCRGFVSLPWFCRGFAMPCFCLGFAIVLLWF